MTDLKDIQEDKRIAEEISSYPDKTSAFYGGQRTGGKNAKEQGIAEGKEIGRQEERERIENEAKNKKSEKRKKEKFFFLLILIQIPLALLIYFFPSQQWLKISCVLLMIALAVVLCLKVIDIYESKLAIFLPVVWSLLAISLGTRFLTVEDILTTGKKVADDALKTNEAKKDTVYVQKIDTVFLPAKTKQPPQKLPNKPH